VSAAADIQRRFAAYNADASETLSVRIGIDERRRRYSAALRRLQR
jgi:hypothetical protein